MMLSRCGVALVLTVVNGWSNVSQNAKPKADAGGGRPIIAGVWRGYSECTVKDSPCHDEVNVYRFSQITGEANKFSVTASKIVDGKEVVMGTSEWRYDEKKRIVECDKPSVQLAVEGNKMEGALRLADGTVYRWIYLRKEN